MAKTDMKTGYVGAYLVRGGASTLDTLIDRLGKEKVIERGSPDLFARTYRKFGVDEAEDIRARARTKPVAGESRVFAFFAPSMTTESQNALLKTLEEPSANALFFIITPSPEMLLATVRSRVQTLEIDTGKSGETLVDVDAFLDAEPQKRLDLLKPLYEHDEDEGRDMASVFAFLQSLERRFSAEKASLARNEGLEAIYRARKFAGDKGSLIKALLEQMALLTPRL